MRRIAHIARFGFVWALLAAGSLVWVTGCKPSAEKLAARELKLSQEIETLCAQIQELQAQGQLAEAASLVEKGLANPAYAAQKSRFFSQKIDLLLAQRNDAAACDLILQAWKAEPQLASAVFERPHAYYRQQNNHAAINAWCKRLLELGGSLPPAQRSQALAWRLSATLAMQDRPETEACIDALMAALSPEAAAPLLQTELGSLIDAGQHATVLALTAYMSDKKPASPLYRNVIVTLAMRCTLAQGDWAKFPSAFNECVATLPDDPLLKLMRPVFSSLQKGSQKELVEQSSKHVIFNAINKTNAVNFASRIWVESGVSTDKKLLTERLDALLAAKVSPIQVGNLFDRYFYDMIGNLDIIRSLCALGERILAVCNDESTVNNLKVKILDGAFITDNFDLAVQMLEQGIPGKDKTWHDMSLPKVKAHRAMAQKNPREAVKYFRDFMNAWIDSKQEEEYDPTSGIAYSREWILGRNANRIAGILDSIPDKAEADKARAEAKGYFKIAVQKASADAEATRLIKEETKNMGL